MQIRPTHTKISCDTEQKVTDLLFDWNIYFDRPKLASAKHKISRCLIQARSTEHFASQSFTHMLQYKTQFRTFTQNCRYKIFLCGLSVVNTATGAAVVPAASSRQVHASFFFHPLKGKTIIFSCENNGLHWNHFVLFHYLNIFFFGECCSNCCSSHWSPI